MTVRFQYERLQERRKEKCLTQEALAEPCSDNEMKTWFLKTFPEIANFHKMREELVSAA